MDWRYEKIVMKEQICIVEHKDLCRINKILPINHLTNKNKIFAGDFTYIKSEKKLQIDFCLTNEEGRKFITNFNVLTYSWHLSNQLSMVTSTEIDSKNLLLHAMDLNKDVLKSK